MDTDPKIHPIDPYWRIKAMERIFKQELFVALIGVAAYAWLLWEVGWRIGLAILVMMWTDNIVQALRRQKEKLQEDEPDA